MAGKPKSKQTLTVEAKLRRDIKILKKAVAMALDEKEAIKAAWWRDREFFDGLIRREVKQRLCLEEALRGVDALVVIRDRLAEASVRFEDASKEYAKWRADKVSLRTHSQTRKSPG